MCCSYFSDSANVTLEIPRAGANSEGDYYCNASNIAGYAVTKTYLDISGMALVFSYTVWVIDNYIIRIITCINQYRKY